MSHIFVRTELLIGEHQLDGLRKRHVLIAGLGGVGSFAAEAMARAGVGQLTLLDHDQVSPSNLNRQLGALHSTLGMQKAEVIAKRMQDINPKLKLWVSNAFLQADNLATLIPDGLDCVLDCIDSIASKAALIAHCQRQGIPVYSSMGAGGRIDPLALRRASLANVEGCALARELRKRLRRMGASLELPVVHSLEPARKGTEHRPVEGDAHARMRAINGTISYLPALFGFTLAGMVLQTWLNVTQTP